VRKAIARAEGGVEPCARAVLGATILWALLLAASDASAGTLTGPIRDEGVAAELQDVIQLPATAGSPPRARVAMLREAPDGSGRLFANDLRGPLFVIQGGTVQTYMDLRVLRPALNSGNLQLGFMSFAFHPDFARNGRFYTAHSENAGATPPNLGPAIPAPIILHAVVTEWQASDPAANVFSGTSRELMRIASPHSFHNLGNIGFDPNLRPTDPDYGLLYIAAGDFGSIERNEPGQLLRLDTVYGCLLRIDPLGEPFVRGGTSFPYGIPPTNPFANDGDPNTFGEIFAFGFRNPENFHFDRGGVGSLFVAEIGQGNVEEVNLPTAGSNHGWPRREGTFALDVSVDPETVLPLPGNDSSFGFTYPVAQYDHDEGSAIAGGLAVRAGPPSALLGKFVFGDIVSGRMFYADVAEMLAANDGNPATTAAVYQLHLLRGGVESTLLDVVRAALGNPGIPRADLRFSNDAAGRLYVTTKQDGFVRELVPVPTQSTAAPALGARSRLYPARPNPFNPATLLEFEVDLAGDVRLTVYDVRGAAVATLVDGHREPGRYVVRWNAHDASGEPAASGVYYARLECAGVVATRKMVLLD
jgi:hypothetical protein